MKIIKTNNKYQKLYVLFLPIYKYCIRQCIINIFKAISILIKTKQTDPKTHSKIMSYKHDLELVVQPLNEYGKLNMLISLDAKTIFYSEDEFRIIYIMLFFMNIYIRILNILLISTITFLVISCLLYVH